MPAILFNGGSSSKRLSPTEAAYLAGFIDGEGCLTIGRARRPDSRSGFGYEALMTISSTDLGALKAVMAMCGNGKIQQADKRNELGHKTLYRIVFSANQIRHVLPQIRPYFLIKGRQADILRGFLASKVSGRKVTAALWQSFENARAAIRTLNRRGLTTTDAETLTVRATKPMPKRGPERFCSYEACGRKHFAKGFCFRHYRKFTLRGGPKQYHKTCPMCETAFIARRSDTVCCSHQCSDKRNYQLNGEKIRAHVAARRLTLAEA